MLGFFSCGKEAVAPVQSYVNEGVVSERDIDCNCTANVTSFRGLGVPIQFNTSWEVSHNGTVFIQSNNAAPGSVGNEFTSIKDFPVTAGVFVVEFDLNTGDGEIPGDLSIYVEVTCVTDPGGEIFVSEHRYWHQFADCNDIDGILKCSWPVSYGCGYEGVPYEYPCPQEPC